MGRSDVAPGQLMVFRGDSRAVFRIVRSPRPAITEWRSHYETGAKPRRIERTNTVLHMALSMWASERQAATVSALFAQRLGGFVAEVVLDGAAGIWFAETGAAGHHAVWGTPDAFESCLRAVNPV